MSHVDSTYEQLRRSIRGLGDDIGERPRGNGTSVAFERCRNFACITKRAEWVQLDVLKEDLTFEDRLRVGPGWITVPDALARVRKSYQWGLAARR